MYELNINTDKGPLVIKWSNKDALIKWHSFQNSFYGDEPKNYVSSFESNFKAICLNSFNLCKKIGALSLPLNPTIVDIGSGISVIDLILYNYIPNSNFWLVDENDIILHDADINEFKFNQHNVVDVSQKIVDTYGVDLFYKKMIYMNEKHPFYNSWEPVKNAIETSGFEASRFNMISPLEITNIPNNIDLLMSSFSWCWHYPKEEYWDKIIHKLKRGGKLLLDILSKDKQIIDDINKELRYNARIIPYNVNHHGLYGWKCLWIKNV
jgi:hypothetical protein